MNDAAMEPAAKPLPESKGFFTLPDGRLEYVRYHAGSDRSPTLVFLHEGLGCVALWKDFPKRVAAITGCDTLVYSRFGYGGSDPVSLPRPLTYMHDEGLNVLPQLLNAASIRRAVLIGHSDGASIAIIHAGGEQDPRIEGLVLMAPHVFNEPVCVASIEKARRDYGKGLKERLALYHGTNIECAFRGWNDAWLDPGFLKWNIEKYVPGIRVPVMVIQGRDDEYGTQAQVRAINRQCGSPVEVHVLDDCGHSPHRDQGERTLALIAGFACKLK